MIKLKKIISQLDGKVYGAIESQFRKNKADNFLFLFQSYRGDSDDEKIQEKLQLNSNSFYVLKSRLYDRIQEHLSGDVNVSQELLLRRLNGISEMIYTEPREVAMARLQKLEKDLLKFDMHNELLVVYSALKKINLYSERYFQYSQQFNKHIAFSLSVEKSEEILGNFNRVFGQYDFSRSQALLDTLLFLRNDIKDHMALNQSRQIELMKNFIELQLGIFCNVSPEGDGSLDQLLNATRKIIDELPQSSAYKLWMPALDYLCFEYYAKTGQVRQAFTCFEKVEAKLDVLLLYTNVCNTSRYLASRIAFLQEQGRGEVLKSESSGIEIHDEHDVHARVHLGIYNAMLSYFAGRHREASARLNEVLNENSFKDYFHINTEVKLTLAFLYLKDRNYELADSLLKSIYRKIKSEKIETYPHVLSLIKVFEQEVKQGNNKVSPRQKDDFALFTARNNGQGELLKHLMYELKKNYN